MRAKIMPINKMSAKIEISAINVTTYVIGPVPCNNAANQTLFFIAEEAMKIAHVDKITVEGHPIINPAMLTLAVAKCKEIYKDVNFIFATSDAIYTEDTSPSDTEEGKPDLDIKGTPA